MILSMESRAAVVSGDTGAAAAMDFILRSTTRGALLLGVIGTIAVSAFLEMSLTLTD